MSSIEATELDGALLELFAGAPLHLVPHLHAPLQSGSDRLLRRMGRHWYTNATYSRGIAALAERMSILGLGADVIAGFPGETEEDHAATIALVEHLPFTYLHVFPYSPRPGTAAERLPDSVASHVAQRRAAELRSLRAKSAGVSAAARAGAGPTSSSWATGSRDRGSPATTCSRDLDDAFHARGERFPRHAARGGDTGLSCRASQTRVLACRTEPQGSRRRRRRSLPIAPLSPRSRASYFRPHANELTTSTD